MTYIAAHFFGLQSEIVNFGYSLSRTLFGTQPKFDLHRTFSFLVYRVKKVNFNHSLTRTLFGTQQKCDLSYILKFYKVKILHFAHSLSHTQRGTQQKCDIYRTLFRFTE